MLIFVYSLFYYLYFLYDFRFEFKRLIFSHGVFKIRFIIHFSLFKNVMKWTKIIALAHITHIIELLDRINIMSHDFDHVESLDALAVAHPISVIWHVDVFGLYLTNVYWMFNLTAWIVSWFSVVTRMKIAYQVLSRLIAFMISIFKCFIPDRHSCSGGFWKDWFKRVFLKYLRIFQPFVVRDVDSICKPIENIIITLYTCDLLNGNLITFLRLN